MSESPVTLILGATSTIATSVAERLHHAGHRLVLAARSPTDLSEFGVSFGASLTRIEARMPETFDAAVAHTLTTHGRLDHVVNAIGSILLKPAHLTTTAEWDEVSSVHLGSAFHTLRAAAPALIRSRGSAVFFSSAAAHHGLANHEAIAAAKAGIEGLVLSAAATYAPRGVRINAVAPGLVRSRASQKILASEAATKTSEAMHPLGRLGAASEVASLVAWLLSPDAGWVTGQCFRIDGGLSSVRAR